MLPRDEDLKKKKTGLGMSLSGRGLSSSRYHYLSLTPAFPNEMQDAASARLSGGGEPLKQCDNGAEKIQ